MQCLLFCLLFSSKCLPFAYFFELNAYFFEIGKGHPANNPLKNFTQIFTPYSINFMTILCRYFSAMSIFIPIFCDFYVDIYVDILRFYVDIFCYPTDYHSNRQPNNLSQNKKPKNSKKKKKINLSAKQKGL